MVCSCLPFEGKSHKNKSIGKSLNTNADGPMPHIGVSGLGHGIIVDVDNFVQVPGHNLGHSL